MLDATLLHELAGQRPRRAPGFLSRAERDRHIARGMHALYRWNVDRSQARRNWNPDRSFDWRAFRKDHSPELLIVLQGFYAVEQYVPDYTAEIVRLVRRSYGRAHFTLRWGAEEEKHADLWRNTLLFSGQRDPAWLEQYGDDLRKAAWELPWDEPVRMLLYTVIQERATQLNYLNIARIARGESDRPQFAGDADPVLLRAATTIAADEAAHYDFFLEGARLYLYYYPEETLRALVDVLRHFVMPAAGLVPDYEGFITALYAGGVFGRRQYGEEVVRPALAQLGVSTIRAVEAGIRRTRRSPGSSRATGRCGRRGRRTGRSSMGGRGASRSHHRPRQFNCTQHQECGARSPVPHHCH
jgi:acyl-[acyl-carrier-protein] desaturase